MRDSEDRSLRSLKSKVLDRFQRSQKTHEGFLFWIGYELWRAGERDLKAITKTAKRILGGFLRDEGIAFGDSRYDWSGYAARDLAREMETRHWEPA